VFVHALAEIFSALLAGIPLWVPPEQDLQAGGLAGVLAGAARAGVTRITLLPSQLDQILRHSHGDSVKEEGEKEESGLLSSNRLRVVIVSGEPLSSALVEAFCSIPSLANCKLVNLYGSTEVAGDVAFSVVSDAYRSTRTAVGKEGGGSHYRDHLPKDCDCETDSNNRRVVSDIDLEHQVDAQALRTTAADAADAAAFMFEGKAPIGKPIDNNGENFLICF